MTSWFRSWHGAPTDNKWLVVARKADVAPGIVSAVAWALFDHASQASDRGSVADFDVETYATFSGFSEDNVTAVIAAMHAKGIIEPNNRLAAWDKRQPKREDDSTDRVRNWRERHAEDVTPCNAEKRTVTQGNNTDTDTDTDKKQNRKNGASAAAAPPVLDPLTTCLAYLDEPNANGPQAIGRLMELRYGGTHKPNYQRIGKMAKDVSGGYKTLAQLVWESGKPQGDPHDYLQGIIRKSKAHRVEAETAAEVY